MQLRIVSFAAFATLAGLAGCSNGSGGSNDPSGESNASTTQTLTTVDATAGDAAAWDQIHAKMVKHAQCMRAHGATDWPDPPEAKGDGGRRMIVARRIDDGGFMQAMPGQPIDSVEAMPRIPGDAGHGPRLFIHHRAGEDGGPVQAALDACASELPGELMVTTEPAAR
ncbi:hypothetical protein LVJ94_28560 [Pendulispora rubella]|uniref:Lipoprotein n=1 Tax=Pendulispora rubella TaxID=2741070 RepID=A0ABZ2KQA9_9BACT